MKTNHRLEAARTALIQKAHELVGRLRRDADDYHVGRIDHGEHGARNRRTWDEISAAGCSEAVLAILRGADPATTSVE